MDADLQGSALPEVFVASEVCHEDARAAQSKGGLFGLEVEVSLCLLYVVKARGGAIVGDRRFQT